MSDLLLAVPWWLFISLIVVGVIVFWSGNNRGQKGPRLVGIALVLVALGLKTLSYFVETDKEKVERQTLELVQAVQKRDWSKFESLLDPDASLGTSIGSIYPNSKALVDGAKYNCERYSLTNVSARVTGVQQDDAGITVDIDATSDQASSPYAIPSSWKLVWDHTGKEWRLHELIWLRLGNEKPDQMGHLLAK
jgi:hypothetical protein